MLSGKAGDLIRSNKQHRHAGAFLCTIYPRNDSWCNGTRRHIFLPNKRRNGCKTGEAEKTKLSTFLALKESMDKAGEARMKLEVCEQNCMLLGLGRGEFTEAAKIVGAATLNNRLLEADATLSF